MMRSFAITRRGIELLAENRIREAVQQGKFDRLPGRGRPLPEIDAPYDENWWVKGWLKRENVNLKADLDDLDEESRQRLLSTLRRRLRRSSR